MTTVFVHNSTVPRGTCVGCKQPATWTLSATIGLFGSVKTELCENCMAHFDVPAWGKMAERQVTGKLSHIIEEAIDGSSL